MVAVRRHGVILGTVWALASGSTSAFAAQDDERGQAHGDAAPAAAPADPVDPADASANVDAAPPVVDPGKAEQEAILLGTLLAGNAGYSVGSSFGGLAYCASGIVFAAASVTYVARGGSFAPAIGPMTFGVGGLALGIYQLASGGDLLALQVAFYRALQEGAKPAELVDVFEPELRNAAERARRWRRVFGLGLVGLSLLTLGAAIYTTARPVTNLEGGTLPTVLYGAAVIDALGAISTFSYETPTEIAWLAYVRGTTVP